MFLDDKLLYDIHFLYEWSIAHVLATFCNAPARQRNIIPFFALIFSVNEAESQQLDNLPK